MQAIKEMQEIGIVAKLSKEQISHMAELLQATADSYKSLVDCNKTLTTANHTPSETQELKKQFQHYISPGQEKSDPYESKNKGKTVKHRNFMADAGTFNENRVI